MIAFAVINMLNSPTWNTMCRHNPVQLTQISLPHDHHRGMFHGRDPYSDPRRTLWRCWLWTKASRGLPDVEGGELHSTPGNRPEKVEGDEVKRRKKVAGGRGRRWILLDEEQQQEQQQQQQQQQEEQQMMTWNGLLDFLIFVIDVGSWGQDQTVPKRADQVRLPSSVGFWRCNSEELGVKI